MPHGKALPTDDPRYNEFFDIVDALASAVSGVWERRKTAPTVRRVSALADLWTAIAGDGLMIGVCVNQPAIIPAALDAATVLKAKPILPSLHKIDKCMPAPLRALKSVDKRLAWLESDKGQPFADKLNSLSEQLEAGSFGADVMAVCIETAV
jgi:hypothetical protein